MNLIILSDADRIGPDQFVLRDHRATHVRSVLKAEEGETVEVGLLDGPVGTARIAPATSPEIRLEVMAWREKPSLPYEVDLICGIPRPKIARKVLTVSAMMGVRAIHFVRANRTDKSYVTSPVLQPPDCLPYLIDGLSQGKLTRLPAVEVHPLFRPFVEDEIPARYGTDESWQRLLAEAGGAQGLIGAMRGSKSTRYLMAIGPEGGWVPFESELLQKQGFVPFVLGPWTLRVEVAVSATLAQLALAVRQETGQASGR